MVSVYICHCGKAIPHGHDGTNDGRGSLHAKRKFKAPIQGRLRWKGHTYAIIRTPGGVHAWQTTRLD